MMPELKVLDSWLRWEDTFFAEYIRKRNSRSKAKNIRCFPNCCSPHNSGGFCGRPVVVRLNEDFMKVKKVLAECTNGKEITVESLRARAMFMTVYEYQNWIEPKDVVSIQKTKFSQDIRSKQHPRLSYISAQVTHDSEKDIRFNINPELLGWHYEWRSNKSTATFEHVLVLFIYTQSQNESDYSLLGVSCSPKFKLKSRSKAQSPLNAVALKTPQVNDYTDHPDVEQKNQQSPLRSKRKSPHQNALIDSMSLEPPEVLTRLKVEVGCCEESKVKQEKGLKDDLKSLILLSIRESKKGLLSKQNTIDKAKKGFLKRVNADVSLGLNDDTLLNIFQEIVWGAMKPNHDNINVCSSQTSNADACDKDIEKQCSIDESSLGEVLLHQIMELMQNTVLTEELGDFFQSCTEGPVGAALFENLRKKDSICIYEENPFIKEFAISLFTKFQTIISKNIWCNLYEKGLVSRPWAEVAGGKIKGSVRSSYEASNSKLSQEEILLYPSGDGSVIVRFLDLLKRKFIVPDIHAKLDANDSLTDPFKALNRSWVCVDNSNETWFLDILSKKLGVIDWMCGKVYGYVFYRITVFADQNKLEVQTLPIVAYLGYHSILLDNEPHVLENITPLFYFVEPPETFYKAGLVFNPDGTYSIHYCLWFRYSSYHTVDELAERNLDDDYICVYTRATVRGDHLTMQKRAFHVKQPEVRDIPLNAWNEADNEDLVGQLEIHYVPR